MDSCLQSFIVDASMVMDFNTELYDLKPQRKKNMSGFQMSTDFKKDEFAQLAGYKDYASYHRSNAWRVFRNANISKECFCCSGVKKLELHHVRYDNLGNEPPEDLETVCKSCHSKIHQMGRTKNIPLEVAHIELKKILENP